VTAGEAKRDAFKVFGFSLFCTTIHQHAGEGAMDKGLGDDT